MKRYAVVFILCLLPIWTSSCVPVTDSTSLVYRGATEQSAEMGEQIPGADIRFVGFGDDGAEILIDDQPATKKVGDSLDWSGTPVPGVSVKVAQRVVWAGAEKLQTAGLVTVTVTDPAPELAAFPDQPTYSYSVATTHTVRRGETIPGTLIKFEGKTDSGAELSGVNGYPYRKLGDSVSWSGRLRANAYLDVTLRVIAYTEDVLQVGGLAIIGLVE